MVHEVFLDRYSAKCKQIGSLVLGTEGSYGNEILKIKTSSFWDGLTITALFNVDTPVKMLVSDGVVSVPQEATAKAGKFTVAFLGVADGVRRISEDLEYIVLPHRDIDAQDPTQPTPSVWEQFVQDVKSAATTFVPSVSQDGVISWTNNGNQPNPEPVYIGGKKGDTPNIQVGTVTTLEPSQQATVERTGTDENPIFNFGIPRGKDGQGGSGGLSLIKKDFLIQIDEDVSFIDLDLENEIDVFLIVGAGYLPPQSVSNSHSLYIGNSAVLSQYTVGVGISSYRAWNSTVYTSFKVIGGIMKYDSDFSKIAITTLLGYSNSNNPNITTYSTIGSSASENVLEKCSSLRIQFQNRGIKILQGTKLNLSVYGFKVSL